MTSVAFSSDGPRALGQRGQDTEAVGRGSGHADAHLRGAFGSVSSVAFSPDGGVRVLSGSFDGTLKLWDAASGHLMRTFEGAIRSAVGCILPRRPQGALGL